MRIHSLTRQADRSAAGTSLRVMAGGMLMLALAAGSASAAGSKQPEVSYDGLHRVTATKVALAYVRPGADFSGYKRVMILDAYVAFRKTWVSQQNRSNVYKITKGDLEKIKRNTAEMFRQVFVEELDTKGGYAVVDSPDTDVLLLRPSIIDLDVTSPDLDPEGRGEKVASSAGAATLVLEFYDSVSSEILARVIDRKTAGGHVLRQTKSATNQREAKRMLAAWAGLLRERLDELHGKGKK